MSQAPRYRITKSDQGMWDVFLPDPAPPLWAWVASLRDYSEARLLASCLVACEAEPLYGADLDVLP